MLPWLRPWMLYAAGAVIAALFVALGAQTVRLADAESDVAKEHAAHEATKRSHAEALAAAINQARVTENSLRAELDDLQAAAAKEKEIAKSREDALVESVRSGQRRLSVAAVCPGAPGPGIRAPAPSGGGAGPARAELDPAAGVALIGISRDGDNAIIERNACIEAYEAVRSKLNAGTAGQLSDR